MKRKPDYAAMFTLRADGRYQGYWHEKSGKGKGKRHYIYGESRLEDIAKEYSVTNTVRLPIDPKLSAAADKGMIELSEVPEMEAFAKKLIGE